MNCSRPMTKDPNTLAQPSRWACLSPRFPQQSRIAALNSGKAIINQVAEKIPDALVTCSDATTFIASPSVLQQVRVVDRGRASGPEDGHDDGQTHHHFGGSDHHHEERDDLPVEVAVTAGERDEGQVRGIEHQLDAHEHDDRVAPDQHPCRTDGEQQRAEVQVIRRIHGVGPFPSCDPWVIDASGSTSGRSAIGVRAPRRADSIVRTSPRARSTRETDSSDGLPSGSSAGVSTALCRAYTPGAGIGVTMPPSLNRCTDSICWVRRSPMRSRWVSTMAPSAAVISRPLVTSKANTYLVKISVASASTLPLALVRSRPWNVPMAALPNPASSRMPKPSPASMAAMRCPRMVSISESAESTPTTMSTNRNSIMTAPV